MYGLAVIKVMTLSGHLSNINEIGRKLFTFQSCMEYCKLTTLVLALLLLIITENVSFPV